MAVPKNKRYRQVVRTRRSEKLIDKINKILDAPVKKFIFFINLDTATNIPEHTSTIFGSADSVCYACAPRDLTHNSTKQLEHLATFDTIGSVPNLCNYCYNLYRHNGSIVSYLSQINADLQQRRHMDEEWFVNMHIYQYPLSGIEFAHGVHFKPLLMAENEPEMHDNHHAASITDIYAGHRGGTYSDPLRTAYLVREWDSHGYEPKTDQFENGIVVKKEKSSSKKKNKKKFKKFIC